MGAPCPQFFTWQINKCNYNLANTCANGNFSGGKFTTHREKMTANLVQNFKPCFWMIKNTCTLIFAVNGNFCKTCCQKIWTFPHVNSSIMPSPHLKPSPPHPQKGRAVRNGQRVPTPTREMGSTPLHHRHHVQQLPKWECDKLAKATTSQG